MMLIISIPLICLVIAVIWISTQSSYGLYFGHSINITNNKELLPLIPNQMATTQNGNVYVVWGENETIYFNSGKYNENKFGTRIGLSDNGSLASFPQIAATEKGNVYAVWIEKNSTSGDANIVFRSSNDGGKNFSSMKELSDIGTLSFYPQIAATEKGNVYVVWIEKNSTTGYSNIVFRSSNTGGNFSSMKELSDIGTLSFYPQIAATEKGNVYVVWVDINSKNGDSNIVFRSSNNSGDYFAQEQLLRGGKDLSLFPKIAATEKGNVYVVWVDINSKNGDSNIVFRSSNNSGDNFADRKHLRTGKLISTSPQITATEKGEVNTIWIDHNSTTGKNDLVFRKSINNGQNFESRMYLIRDGDKLSKSLSPQIAGTENGNAYAVWIEDHVKFKEILDKDNLSGKTISLSNKISTSSPQIAATENGNVYVVWIDKNGTGSEESLLFKRISEFFFDRN